MGVEEDGWQKAEMVAWLIGDYKWEVHKGPLERLILVACISVADALTVSILFGSYSQTETHRTQVPGQSSVSGTFSFVVA